MVATESNAMCTLLNGAIYLLFIQVAKGYVEPMHMCVYHLVIILTLLQSHDGIGLKCETLGCLPRLL